MMMPVVEKMAEAYDGKIKIGKLNVDENNAIAGKYGVMSIPSFMVFKNGEVVNSSTGAMSQAALAKMLDEAL
jgi:thioredoxin 1